MQVEFIHGDPNLPDFGEMFGGWLTEYDNRAFLIDCGVGSGGPSLTRRVKGRLGSRPLDFVLLTHIHLDHSGGLADILTTWPETKVVVHAKGMRHLVEPDRLWASTKEVMGELADMYGRPAVLDPARFIAHNETDLPGLRIIETPGHAPHHLSFRLGEIMFLGEAGGCPYWHNGRLLNRPATPPRYFPGTTLASIQRLLEEPDGTAYGGHSHEPVPAHECLEVSRAQLFYWDDFIRRPKSARRSDETYQDHLNRLTDELFAEDPNLGPLNELPPRDLWRERYFMRNSVEGFVKYHEEEALKAADT